MFHELIIQINGGMFKQTKGIPQGSFLSTVLCSLFYGQLDRETGILNFPSDDLIMRYVDDFVIISPCRDRVLRLVQFLETGFPEFGIVFNPEKTQFSFNLTDESENYSDDNKRDKEDDDNEKTETDKYKYFTWCGLRFDPITLDISPDYTNFEYTSNYFFELFLFIV